MRKRRAVIFGVTGQDGSYLADLLLSKGYEVRGVSRRTSTPNDERIAHLDVGESFNVVCGDVSDPMSVYRILETFQPDEIYNLAAQSHVQVSFDEPGHTWDVTAKGALHILEWCRQWHGRQKADCVGPRFYQASSSEMFGAAYSQRVKQVERNGTNICGSFLERYQDETTPFLPQSPYAIAKLAAHHATRLYREAYGIFACSGILFNHESERRGDKFVTRKISKYCGVLAGVRRGRLGCIDPLQLGNLDASRDWGHASDYVEAMWLMLQHDKPDDYVVATGETHTVQEFLDEAFAVIGIDNPKPYFEVNQAFVRPAEVNFLCGDASKARKVLGWKPKVTFQDLVKRMVLSDMANTQKGQRP